MSEHDHEEEHRVHNCPACTENMVNEVEKAVRKVFSEYGFHEDDRTETTLDMVHLRQSREGTELIRSSAKKSIVGLLSVGIATAIWLGFQALLGK